MCYIDERDTAHHKTPCRDLLQGIPGYENGKELLAAGGTFGCWHGTTGDSPGPAFATNNVIENSCKDGVQQETRLHSWNVRTTTLGVCIKGLICDGAPQRTVPPSTPSIPDERRSDNEDDVGSGELDDKITRKNLALGKRTKQSSFWDAGYSQNAVDGDRSTNWYSGSCTHTEASLRDNVWDVGTTNPWWYVDLGSSYPIGKVVIVNRRSPKDSVTSRINPFEIRIGNSKDVTANPKCESRHVFPADEDVMEVSCGGIQGRYVGIRLPGENRILTLCEVEVYAADDTPQSSPTMIPAISDGSLGDDEDEVGSGEPYDKGEGPQTTMPSTTTIPTPTEDPASDDDDDDADSGEVEGSVYSNDNRLACEKHYVLNDPWRSVRTHRERGHRCDQKTMIKENLWFRFVGEGGTMIPTQRPPATHRCSTHAPVWMKGNHPTVEQGVVRRKVCAFWEEEECHWSWHINVLACPGGYYVYKLPKPKICYLAYCTTDEDIEGSGEPDGSGDLGYTKRGDTQYKIYTEEKTYDAAKQTCAADGGHLVDIETEAVYIFLLGMIRDVDVIKDYWIGLNDQADEQRWTWSDGKLLKDGGFTKWAPGEPNNNEGIQDCGQLWAYKNFQWDDDRCSYKKYFICQIGPGEAYDGDDIIFKGSGEEPLPTQENINGCPENNIVVLPSGKKYVASDDTRTYEDAQTECRRQGGIVAIPRNDDEQRNLVFLKNCVSRENQFWLGVRWTSSVGWVGGKGSPLGDYTTWAPGEPNDRYNGYRCSHIVYGNKEGDRRNNWADAYCNSFYNYVCEIENAPSWSASSQFDSRHSPDCADINSRETSDKAGAWAAATNNQDQWLMRDLGEVKAVTGVITKGRDYSPDWPYGPHDQYVTSYVISFGVKDGDETFYTNENNDISVFTGNSDRNAEVYNDFREYSGPIMARYIKIHPRTWHQHISMRMKIVTSDIVPNVNASSCSEVKSTNPASKDGEYTLHPFSTCQDISLRVYCHNMASKEPEEFLTLPSGPESNFANIYADRLRDNYGSRCNGPLQDPYSNRAGTTKFNKIRIKFENSRVKVIRDDYTFASTDGFNNVPYGEAGDCYSWKQGCAKGTFSLDLAGTGLSLASDVHWVMEERYPGYISINDMFVSKDRTAASARCGGWCGHCWPVDKNLILSHPQCDSNSQRSKANDKVDVVKNVYQGCFKDGKRRRLPEALLISMDMTADVCVKHCRQEGYSYAGTQYYKECWCGTELPTRGPHDDNECATPCGGNQNEMCGGEWRLSVYKVEPTVDVKLSSEGPHECQTSDGASYRGTVAVTRSGRTCQRWDQQIPHEHTRTSDNYPSSGLVENYCRNPDETAGVWCYTTDPNKRWDFCDVAVCGSVTENPATQPPVSTEISTESGSLIENPSTQVPVKKAETDVTSTVCPVPGYIRLRGACYKFFAEPKTYDEARRRCAEDGGLLAMPKGRATNRFFTNHHLGSSWVGLTDINREGRWVYEDGQLLKSSGYSNWARGEPNDADGIEDCAEFTPTRAFWNDAPCNSSKPFTCQIGVTDATSASPTPTPEPTPTPTPASLSTPRVTTEGRLTVLKTSNVTLKCRLKMRRRNINHRINWYRIGENGTQGAPLLTYIDRHAFYNYKRTAELRLAGRLEAVDDHVSLRILNVKVEDSGTYRCEVILASQQRAYADVNMTILECPTEKKKGPHHHRQSYSNRDGEICGPT
ncbi:uncharacterized protein LOC118422970 [Branchiostoma floridae]|uniref:Uncharacterized protein LOC118422970 n=1 Tax=Branchiostoma floridae TaxID=7739 RepID=A0A9J7N1R9_BRAFL|nr:uncharacterized protein LOC118422970 [Branchiostoma floridae]